MSQLLLRQGANALTKTPPKLLRQASKSAPEALSLAARENPAATNEIFKQVAALTKGRSHSDFGLETTPQQPYLENSKSAPELSTTRRKLFQDPDANPEEDSCMDALPVNFHTLHTASTPPVVPTPKSSFAMQAAHMSTHAPLVLKSTSMVPLQSNLAIDQANELYGKLMYLSTAAPVEASKIIIEVQSFVRKYFGDVPNAQCSVQAFKGTLTELALGAESFPEALLALLKLVGMGLLGLGTVAYSEGSHEGKTLAPKTEDTPVATDGGPNRNDDDEYSGLLHVAEELALSAMIRDKEVDCMGQVPVVQE